MKYYYLIVALIFLQLVLLLLFTEDFNLFIVLNFLVHCIIFCFIWRILYIIKNLHNIRSVISLFSHMLQSNISGLRIFLDGLSVGEPLDKKTIDTAKTAVTELYCVNKRIQELTRLSWEQDTILLPHLLSKMVAKHQCVHLIMDDLTKHIKVPTIPFQLIIDELIMNARYASGVEERIILETMIVKSFFHRRLSITVRDYGIGMTHAMLQKAESPFFSTRDGYHLGLGLTCCKELMRSMSGELEIISSPEKGTRIHISYPL